MRHILMIGAVCACAGVSHGALSYVSASRSVSASAFSGTAQSFSSTSLTLFDRSASSDSSFASASASLRSELLTDRITFRGSAGAADFSTQTGAGQASAGAGLTVRFTLDHGSDFAILGTVLGNPGNQGIASTMIRRVSDSAVLLNDSGGGPLFGSLAAGTYELVVGYGAGVNGIGTGSGNINFDRQFVIPAPAAGASLGLLLLGVRRRR